MSLCFSRKVSPADSTSETLAEQSPVATRKAIADLGKSSYIAVSTGFWYEWSLAIPAGYGIDFAKREVTFFDEGETKISTSTWPQVRLRLQKTFLVRS